MDAAPEKKIIVVVEDTAPIAELIKDTLNTEPDYQAIVALDGALALDVIHSVKASLILLDLNLPGISGMEIYDLLQADAATQAIPVIFVTATPDEGAFAERGITKYLAKPFDLDELLVRVAEVCRPSELAPG
ncbi:MAG TPA: response regulator [Chloroflexia bacterium]|nr:response regulator [Chloroflexia bacterium]